MATRTISAAGGNYNAVGTWDEGAAPTSSDDVVVRADGTSGNVTVTAAAAAKTITLTAGAYSGTFIINATFTLTVSGNITLNSSGTCVGIGTGGVGTLAFATSGTLTSNGKTIGSALNFQITTGTLTLADNAIVTGVIGFGGSSTPVITSTSKTITANGGWNQTSLGTLTGTTLLLKGGTITSTITNNTFGLQGTGTVEFDGNITYNSPYFRTAVVKYTSGTWTQTGSGELSLGGSMSLQGSPPVHRIAFRNTGTLTLNSSLTATVYINPVACTLTFTGSQLVTTPEIQVSSTAAPGIIEFGNCTFDVDNILVSSGCTMSLLGSYSLSVDNAALRTGSTLNYACGQTLSVSTLFRASGSVAAPVTVKSCTASSSFTLALGSSTVQSSFTAYTDVAVTGRTIANVFGGTLTRTSGIINKATNASMHGTDPGVTNTTFGTGYVINGDSLTGTFVTKMSSAGGF
jgi:hypothetical protein